MLHNLVCEVYALISLCTSAHDVAQSRQHKSISASDVLKALEIMQFADITGKLQNELAGELSCTLNS